MKQLFVKLIATVCGLEVLCSFAGAQHYRHVYHHFRHHVMYERVVVVRHRHYRPHRFIIIRNGHRGYWGHRNGLRVWIRL